MKTAPDLSPESVRAKSIGRMLNVLSNRMKAEMKKRLAAIGLSIDEFFIFMIVLNEPDLSQSLLSEKMVCPAYATSRIIDGMVTKNLATRRVDPCSRRTHKIALTAKGHALAPDVLQLIESVNDWLLAPLDPAEKETFTKSLAKLI